MGSQKKICFYHDAFRWCKYGTEGCSYSHDVEPHFEDIAFAIIDSRIKNRSTAVQFVPAEGGRVENCYIDERWSPYSGEVGELVRLSVFGKKLNNSKQYVRIDRIMQRAKCHHLRIKDNDCLTFATYSSCDLENRCKMKHDSKYAAEQSFHVATVVAITDQSSCKSGPCILRVNLIGNAEAKSYYIPQFDSWHMNCARVGDVVITQESQRVKLNAANRLHYGRIVAVIGNAHPMSDANLVIEHKLQKAFVPLEKRRMKNRLTAFSVEKCHVDGCKRVGIHAPVSLQGTFLKKLDTSFIPLHMQNGEIHSESILVALTVYAHSKCDVKDHSPILTPVFVERDNYFPIQEHNENRYSTDICDMWDAMEQAICNRGLLMNDISRTLAAGFVVDFPNTWRERVIIRKLKKIYNKHITEFMRGREKFIITKMAASEVETRADDDIVIPWRYVQNLKEQSEAGQSDEKLAFTTLCAAKRAAKDFGGDEADRYQMDVVQCENLHDNKIVTIASPAGQTTNFVNQQIAISMMMPSEQGLFYSKDDLLGILVSRRATPTLFKTVVRDLTRTTVLLQFCGIYGLQRANRKVKLRCIFPSLSHPGSDATTYGYQASPESNESVKRIYIKSLSSNHYCNSELVRLTNVEVAAFDEATMDAVIHPHELQRVISELPNTVSSAPYKKEDNGTRVTLSRGVELQLQAAENETLKLRLLKVGTNCHLCLFHMQSPSNAFRCDRQDTKEFVTAEDMTILEEMIRDDCLKTRTLQDVDIHWKGSYYSGGTFERGAAEIGTKYLLCIRKEIQGERSEVSFVWTCHGVVCNVTDERVTFMTTSLQQCQNPTDEDCEDDGSDDSSGGFIIEIIDTSSNSNAAATAKN